MFETSGELQGSLQLCSLAEPSEPGVITVWPCSNRLPRTVYESGLSTWARGYAFRLSSESN